MARGRKSERAVQAAPEAPPSDITAATPLPKRYTPAHCDAVVAFMARGFTLKAFAGEIGVSAGRLEGWRQRHPRFDEAVRAGEAACMRTLEANLLTATTGAVVSAHIFALKNASGVDAASPLKAELIVKFV